ncbi:MAG: PQQ-dependent sugar dehydrogenase, partial [Bacteroidetes bacterium]|nr:PQQ-dependent sugar dehydrogenase [Bacteroidota bacterium]
NSALGKQSAVWAFGFRNNQGFAYAYINGADHLYGQMHGPFSDDEINEIHAGGNYGHPLVIGFKKDGNYNGAAAGNPYTYWTDGSGKIGGLPVIVNEENNADSMNKYHTYYDPIYTYFPASAGSSAASDLTKNTAVTSEMQSVQYMYYWFNQGQQSNTYWPSEAPSGMDVYTNSMIPGWKNSLISSVMKGAPNNFTNWKVVTSGGSQGAPSSPGTSTAATGKLMRLKLNANGDGLAISPTNSDSTLKTASAYADDTVSYFAGKNRFRDIAISKDGLSLFAIIDSSSTTSGPTATNPANSLCKGCLLKFTFLGYHTTKVGIYNTSSLSDTIPVGTAGTYNSCVSANPIVINTANDTLWVPITDTAGNIIAEINANGNVLDSVYTSYYLNNGTVRETSKHTLYLDRSITITPKVQPVASKPVHLRLYFTNAEYTALANAHNSLGQSSSITGINNIGIFKTSDVCGGTYSNTGSTIVADTPFTRTTTAGSTGYALQGSITHFSTFYFANGTQTLPMKLISFTGAIKNNVSQLQWITENESGTQEFAIERSTDGVRFDSIGVEAANGNDGRFTYDFNDAEISQLTCPAVYYRLKIIDVASDYIYSDIIKLPLNGVAGSLIVRPNPAVNSTTVQITAVADDNANWELIDNNGASVLRGSTLLRKGVNAFDINLGSLPKGMYYLKITGSYINQGTKIGKL